VTTQADGSYLLGGLPAGTYDVRVNQTDYVGVAETATRSQLGYLADYVHHVPETSSADAQPFAVTAGQTTVADESIYPADSVTGTVTDSTTGLPVSGVSVVAWGGSVWNDTWAYTPGFTDSLGRYQISGLGPGTYTICFEFDTTQPLQKSAYECWKDHPSMDGADPVQVNGFGATVTGIDQRLDTTG
jgi:protocatechuate 3,4-dioxygenase beta subunit